jgi:hypothetical protein
MKTSVFRFIGFLQPFKNTAQFIVTDRDGYIDGMTMGASNLLRILPRQFESKRMMVQSMCPNLCKYFLNIRYSEQIKNENLDSFLTSLDGIHIASTGQKIVKFFPYGDGGVERFEKFVEKKASQIDPKYSAKDKIGHWLNYSKSVESK